MRWLFKKLQFHPNAYYNYIRNAKVDNHAQNLIVVNGFKYFNMIPIGLWGTVR